MQLSRPLVKAGVVYTFSGSLEINGILLRHRNCWNSYILNKHFI